MTGALSPLIWTEGMNLAPHHFQLQRRFFENSLTFATQYLAPGWYRLLGAGFDAEALRNGVVSLVHARGVMPDGLAFHSRQRPHAADPRRARGLFPHRAGPARQPGDSALPAGRTERGPRGRDGGGPLRCRLTTGRTDLLRGFISNKTRRKFSAYLARQATGKVGFEFEPRAPRAGGPKKTAATAAEDAPSKPKKAAPAAARPRKAAAPRKRKAAA